MTEPITPENTRDAAPQATPIHILCVDDEPNILAALQRLFRSHGMAVRTADSGAAGLALMEESPADVVISDMMMPEMNGAQLLQQVRLHWSDSVRFLLTGQADAATIMQAVNQGEISKYVSKPWDDAELVNLVRLALEQKERDREKVNIAALALRRAEELKALNDNLEQTGSPGKGSLSEVNERLKNNFVVSLKIFSSLIEIRRTRMAGHSRRVADLARKIATRLGLEPALVQEVFVAGLLHEVGKLGFSEELLDTPVANMKPWQLQEYRAHPTRAEQLLMPLQDLRGAAGSIGSQLERFDGGGHPNHLRGRAILVGARILAVCADYDNLQIGVLAPRSLKQREAQAVIETSSGKRYDPWVVEAFVAVVTGAPDKSVAAAATSAVKPKNTELILCGSDLEEGMILTRDLISPSGLIMLPSGNAFDARLIEKVLNFEKGAGIPLTVYVQGPETA